MGWGRASQGNYNGHHPEVRMSTGRRKDRREPLVQSWVSPLALSWMKHESLAPQRLPAAPRLCLCQPADFVGTWFCHSLKGPPPRPCFRSTRWI